MADNPTPGRSTGRKKPAPMGARPPRRKRSPAKSNRLPKDDLENALEPAAGGPAPQAETRSGLPRRQFTQEEWEYLERLPTGSLAEEIRLMRVLSLRLVQQGLQASDPGIEIRYYSEATRIMARIPALLKAEKALNTGQDDLTLAMIEAIQAVLEEDQKEIARQLELPLETKA